MPYQLLDHTADVGIKVQAATKAELYQEAARAFLDLLSDAANVNAATETSLEIHAANPEELLVRLLSELLFLYETTGLLLCELRIDELSDGHLHAIARGEKFDAQKHPQKYQIKAVTYHQLQLSQQGQQWHAQVIFDV